MLNIAAKMDSQLLTFLRIEFHVVFNSPGIASSSYCSVEVACAGTTSEIVTSSTYFQCEQRGDANFRSFIMMTNKMGLILLP